MSSITGKRASNDSPTTTTPIGTNKKRPKIDSDFDAKFIASSQDDLDIGLLRVQNRRLAERLLQRQRIESELRGRIEQMEKKQLNDDTKLYVINRYWNQLNEDMRLLLQRFDNADANNTGNSDDDDDEATSGKENEETTSFLRQLANCDKEELDEALQQRVLLSTRAVSKVLQAFDRIVQRNEKVMQALKGHPDQNCSGDDLKPNENNNSNDIDSKRSVSAAIVANLDVKVKQLNGELTKENKNLTLLVTSLHEKHHTISLKFAEVNDKVESKELQVDELKNRIDELEFELNKSRTREQRLEDHLYEAREKLRDLQSSGILSNKSDNNNSSGTSSSGTGSGGVGGESSGISSGKIEDLRRELEEQRDTSQSRLAELEQLNNEHKETLKFVEKYKMDLQCIPDSVIHESAEYKSLQSHFSVLFNESMQLKTQLEENRTQLTSSKNTHLRQIEQMESEELSMQKRLRNECMQLEDSLAQVRKEYEMLRIEFEQTLAANEQTGPINREMRNLITSLQNHTQQLKGENARIKKKLKESNVEIGRLKVIIEQNGMKVCCGGLLLSGHKFENSSLNLGANISNATNFTTTMTSSSTSPSAGATCTVECCTKMKQGIVGLTAPPAISHQHSSESAALSCSDSSNDDHEPALTIKLEDNISTSDELIKKEKIDTKPFESTTPPYLLAPTGGSLLPKKESPNSEAESQSSDAFQVASFLEQDHSSGCVGRSKSDEIIRDLRNQLKKSFEAQRELKLLLDMFKSVDKEKREKAHLMGNEKKMKLEIEELRMQIKKLQEAERRGDRRKLTDEEYARKISKFEEVIQQLQKNVAAHKQEEEALLNEMEVTGQAFEDMQEQNLRLMQQLKEKDDANFKLMSERIKSNQIHKLLKEEKEMLTEQIITLQSQVDAQNQVVRKLEEKERILQNNLATVEKEMGLRQQAMDFHKRKAIESSQAAADLKLHLDKYVAQIKDAQSIVADKTSAWQQESFRTKRLHEEVMSYKRKYERAKKFELATTADEVLQEEIRELKEELTCPSCKTKRKDAVLNKCFHVFCYDCLKTRYETRQRKCPKCNQSFSANDFHRLYLA